MPRKVLIVEDAIRAAEDLDPLAIPVKPLAPVRLKKLLSGNNSPPSTGAG